jgi:flagellar biosynthesis/type III secretory pathway M-ring protein FliF/YscJ
VLLFLLFARHVLKKTFARPEAEAEQAQTETVPVEESAVATPEEEPEQPQTTPLKERVAATVGEDPDRAAQYLRMWLNE